MRKLPTALVASFRSTLAEIREADLVLHAVDASSPRAEEERRVAVEVLDELGVPPGRILTVWTKQDLVPGEGTLRRSDENGGRTVSAVTGAGIDLLEAEVRRLSEPQGEKFRVRIPYADGRSIAAARASFRVLEEEKRVADARHRP